MKLVVRFLDSGKSKINCSYLNRVEHYLVM